MGFGDILGDTWDAFADGTSATLGVAMDFAKAGMNTGGPIGSDAKKFASSFSARRADYFSDHKTMAAASRRITGTVMGGLEAAGYPAHMVQRGVSTLVQHDGPIDVPGIGGNAKAPSLRDAWSNSAKTSTGQAALVAAGQADVEGITFKNAWQFGERGNEKFDSKFSWRSGTLDTLMIFSDPLILGGKLAKGVKLSRAAIKPGDLDTLAGVGKQTGVRARRVKEDHQSLLNATEGTNALENYELFRRHGVNNAAGLGSVLAGAGDRATRSLVLRHSMGDKRATQELAGQRQDLINRIDRMNKDLDDEIFPLHGTPEHDGLFDADYWMDPAKREELLKQRDGSEKILDRYNRTMGNPEALRDGALPNQDDVGLGLSMIKRTKASKNDLRAMKGTSSFSIQPGVGGVVTHVSIAPKNLRPSGYVDFHDAEAGIREVDSFTKRIPAFPAETRTAMLNRYIDAPDDNARRNALQQMEDETFDHLGKHYKIDPEDMQDLKTRFFDERNAWARGQGENRNVYGHDASGVAIRRPIGEAQLENGAATMPIDHIKAVLRQNSGRYRAFKNVAGESFRFTNEMADFVNDTWKFTALFRGGYPVRNAADGQMRMMAFLTAHSYLGIQKENLATVVKREANRGKRYKDADAVTEEPKLGMGELQIGPYDNLADAMGRTPDEAAVYHNQVSGVENISTFIAGRYHGMLDNLRGTGSFVSKQGDERGWDEDMIRVVNQQLRNSVIARRLLKGDPPEKVIAWLRSGEGRAVRRRMVFGNDTAESLVAANLENLNHLLPKEFWSTFAERPMVADDLTAMWSKVEDRPVVNAEQVAYSMGQGNVAETLQKVQRKYFEAVSTLTDDKMGRHPLFVQLYRGHQIELMKRMDPKLKGDLDLADQARIEQQARIWARREMKSIMFDVAQKTDLGHFVRFIMPFYSAWEDAITKYSRLIVRDPSRLGYGAQAWTAPNDASFMEVTDADGKPVSAEDSKLSDDEGMVMPASWAKALGLDWSPKLSKASFNIALQGDPLWLPGWGPIGTAPINEAIRKIDDPDLATLAQDLGILPFGVQDNGAAGWRAFLAGGFRQEGMSNGRKQRMLGTVMQTMIFEAAKQGKPEPSWKEIQSRYSELVNLRRLTSAMSPVSVQYQSPYQFYIDQSHAYDAQVGAGKKFKDFSEADAAFLKDFGEDYYIFRMSMSKTNVAIAPSKRADKAARGLKDLIDANPRHAALFIGPNNTGEYDRNVYTLQQGRKIGESAMNWRDTHSDPKESIRLNRVEQGWIEYGKISTQVNTAMEKMGLTSINQKEAGALRQAKHDWIENIVGKDGPDWAEAWYADYQEFGSSAVTGFLGAAKQAIADKRINERPDIVALGSYIQARSTLRKALQTRYKAGGSASLSAQSNGDLANIWAEFNTGLRQQSVFFEDYWNRYLERDDLTKVVR